MPIRYQSRPPLQQTHSVPSSHSYTVAMQNADADDEDDICPVCESECTCAQRSHAAQSSQPVAPSLKIRLTVPPSLLSTLQTTSKPFATTTSASGPDGGVPFPTIPKKRGRPTKAEAEARRAAAARLADFEQQDPAGSTRFTHAVPVLPKSTSKKVNNRQQQSTRKGGRPKKVNSIYRASSADSDSDRTTSTSIRGIDSYSEALGPGHISDSSELSSVPDPGDESSLEEEEERYVIQEQVSAREKARVRREMGGGGGGGGGNKRRFDSRNQNNWQVHSAARSADESAGGSTTSSESDIESDSGNVEEDEDEPDADDDEDADGLGGIHLEGNAPDLIVSNTMWTDSDDEFDADVFFASLSDSEASTSAFDHVFEAQEDEESDGPPSPPFPTIPVEEAEAAGLLSPLAKLNTLDGATVLVSREFNGQPVFTNGNDVVMGLLDLDFELTVVAQQHAPSQVTKETVNNVDDDEEMWIPTDEDFDSEHGDTTDDDDAPLRGVQTPSGIVLFSFPTPPVFAIDPLSTLSPVSKRKNSSAKGHKHFDRLRTSLLSAPKPAEILARGGVSSAHHHTDEGNVDDGVSVDDGSSTWSSAFRAPNMGVFEKGADTARQHVIVNGTNNADIPSPLSHFERVRRGSSSSRGRKRVARRNESPFSAKRHCQSPLSNRSKSTENRQTAVTESTSEVVHPSPALIALDDVLDTSLIETPDDSEGKSNGTGAAQYVSRWDRVPMEAFRRTRTNPGASSGVQPVMEWAPHQPPPVSDGFCYGSPGGILMRSGPLFNTNPSVGWPQALSSPSSHLNVNSPFIPPNDGDRTPTGSAGISFNFGNTPPDTPTRVLSHKQRRKEKHRQQAIVPQVPPLSI